MMVPLLSRVLIASFVFFIFAIPVYAQKGKGEYQCTPCGNECDKESYSKPGECRHCHMKLVKKSDVQYKSLQPGELCEYVRQHPEVVLLDVRTKEEFTGKDHPEHGTVRNAINIPIQELESRVGELEKYRDKEVLVYCSYSKRSARASALLVQKGFVNVMNLEGGLSQVQDGDCIVRKK